MARIALLLRRTVDGVLVGSLAVIVVVMILQVIMRYVFRAALPWPEELAQFLLVLLALLGSYRALEKDMHIRLQVLDGVAARRLVAGLRVIGYLMTAALAGYIAYGGWSLAIRSLSIPSTALRVPLGIVYFTVPLAFGLMFVLLALIIVRIARDRPTAIDGER